MSKRKAIASAVVAVVQAGLVLFAVNDVTAAQVLSVVNAVLSPALVYLVPND